MGRRLTRDKKPTTPSYCDLRLSKVSIGTTDEAAAAAAPLIRLDNLEVAEPVALGDGGDAPIIIPAEADAEAELPLLFAIEGWLREWCTEDDPPPAPLPLSSPPAGPPLPPAEFALSCRWPPEPPC